MQLLRTFSAFALSLSASSCLLSQGRVNEPFSPEAITGLDQARTTDDVVALLGAPVQVVELGDRTAYRFESTRTKSTGLFLLILNVRREQTKSDRIWCFFDEQGQLTHVGKTLDGDSVEFGLW